MTVYRFRHEPAQNLWRFSKSDAINKFRIIVIAQGEKTKIQKEKRKKASQGEKTKIQKEKKGLAQGLGEDKKTNMWLGE